MGKVNVIIAEDETPSAERLTSLIKQIGGQYEIKGCFGSLAETGQFLQQNKNVDLLFLDIQLSDGLGLDLLSQNASFLPVIFTTAYEKYSLQAFKVNTIDYLLKPVDFNELYAALNKFNIVYNHQGFSSEYDVEYHEQGSQKYKKRFLVKSGDHYYPIDTSQIAYFYTEDGIVFLIERSGKKRYIVNYTLDDLGKRLDPEYFFRINRKFIVNLAFVKDVQSYYNGRLLVVLNTECYKDLVVSRERVGPFKQWLDQ